MKRKTLVSILCIILAALMLLSLVIGAISIGAYAVSQEDIDALQAQKDAITAKKNGLQANINDLRDEQASVIAQKEALDEQNELNRQAIELIVEQIDLYAQLIDQKAREVEAAVALEEQQFEEYCAHVRAMEENGNYTYLDIIFQCRSISQLLSAIDEIGEIMGADQRLYDEYSASREHTEAVKAEYETTYTELNAKQGELEDEKAELEAQIEAAYLMIAELQEDIDAYVKMYEENEALEAALGSQISNLAAQLAAEEEAARRAAEEAQKPYVGIGSSATGNYMWPCPSSNIVTSQYGWRWHPVFQAERFHGGVDISANSGASIVAADSGTVSVAAYSASAGNYVVLYHSGGDTTTYMHMSSIGCTVGQSVTKGDVIGYVGSTGVSTGPHLHFEIRLNGSTVDPLGYFTNYVIWDS